MALSILRKPVFRNYFLADIISGFGSGLSFVGANWYILDITGSSVSVGEMMSLTIFGVLLGSPVAGTIADRFNRKQILMISNWIRGAFLTLMAVCFYTGHFSIAFVYFFGFMNGVGYSVFRPASGALIQELLEKKDLIEGNSLIEVSLQVGMFLAGLVSGIVYQYSSFGVIMVIDAVTFGVSNFFLMRIRYRAVVVEDRGASFSVQFKNGLDYLFQRRLLFCFGMVLFLPYIATIGLNVVLPGYVKETLQANAIVFGLSDMNYGIGACLAGLIIVTILARISEFRAVAVFAFLSFSACVFLTANRFIAGLYIGVLIFGFCNSAMRIIMNSKVMAVVPESYMGRAMSVWVTISMLAQIGLSYAVGNIMSRYQAHTGFLMLAGIMLAAFLGSLYFYPKIQPETESVQEQVRVN